MLNRLPLELVRHIIESSAPSTYQRKTYHDRQAILCRFCLVCRLLREIAQPLLFEVVWTDGQSKLIALHKTLQSEGWRGTIQQLIVEDKSEHDGDADLERILRSCQGLRTLTLDLHHGRSQSLSVLQDLHHLADLSLFGSNHFPSSFKLQALTSLRIDYSSMEVAPTLLDPMVLPSLRSLVLFKIYHNDDIAYLNRSRLDDLLPQLEALFLDSRIIQMGLDYLIPNYSRTLFDFCPPSSDDRIDILQVAQHLRIYKHNLRYVIQKFAASIANQDRQISLRSVYLDIGLENLSSLSTKEVRAVKDLLRACKEKRIEVIYEDQGVGFVGELRPSQPFRRRQREIRMLASTRE